jgi:transcriptional regulator with GAF, ATPase, and Fis domain
MSARAIHDMSGRRGRPLVKVNCAALPETLIESELFGHEKGAFTGATLRRAGRFELADHGTIFLDEIGELPLPLQAKLLRVLQEGEFERLGGTRTEKVDVRVIAATNRDVFKMVQDGTFREDLYYRVSVFPLVLPPLRERKGDLPLLVKSFVERFARRMGRSIERVPAEVMARLEQYSWPGNVRELQNVIERAVILSPGPELFLEDRLTPSRPPPPTSALFTLEEVERRHILRVLDDVNWKITGKGGAAERLDMNPSTLRSRMAKLRIHRPESA